MSQGAFVRFNSRGEVEKRSKYLIDNMMDWDFTQPLVVKLEKYQDPRSLSQNALSHIWYREIAKEMHNKGHRVEHDKPELVWKIWLKKRFLGTDTYKIGKHEISEQVKSSSDLKKGEMAHYLDQVYHWAIELGIRLSIPAECEYAEIKKQQES
jgi:hypothetical protein